MPRKAKFSFKHFGFDTRTEKAGGIIHVIFIFYQSREGEKKTQRFTDQL